MPYRIASSKPGSSSRHSCRSRVSAACRSLGAPEMYRSTVVSSLPLAPAAYPGVTLTT
jgi:hypothetical protein